MDVTLPSGKVIQGVPEGTSKDAIKAKALSSGKFTENDFIIQQTKPPLRTAFQQNHSEYSNEQILAANKAYLLGQLGTFSPDSYELYKQAYTGKKDPVDDRSFFDSVKSVYQFGRKVSAIPVKEIAYRGEQVISEGVAAGARIAEGNAMFGNQQFGSLAEWFEARAQKFGDAAKQVSPADEKGRTFLSGITEEVATDITSAMSKTYLNFLSGTSELAGKGVEKITPEQPSSITLSDLVTGNTQKEMSKNFLLEFSDFTEELSKEVSVGQQEMKADLLGDDKDFGRIAFSVISQTASDLGANIALMKGLFGAAPWKIGMKPGDLPKLSKISQTIGRMGKTEQMAEKLAMSAERMVQSVKWGVGRALITKGDAKQRLQTGAVTTAYMGTTAFSGFIDGAVMRVVTDFAMNSGLSYGLQYKDVLESNMSGSEKFLMMLPSLVADGFFSARTAPLLQGAGATPDVMRDFKFIQEASYRAMSPKHNGIRLFVNPVDIMRAEIAESGKGGIEVAKTEQRVNEEIDATGAQLRADIAEAQRIQAEEAKALSVRQKAYDKAQEKKDRQLELTQKEKDLLSQDRDSLPQKAPTQEAPKVDPVEIEGKKAIARVIDETKNQSATCRAAALQGVMDEVRQITDNAKGRNVKRNVNIIAGIRQPKPKKALSQEEFYKELERTSQEAAKSGVKGVGGMLDAYEKFAYDNMTWREADAFMAKLQDGIQKHPTLDGFSTFADKTAGQYMSVKNVIDRTVPVKDLSGRSDLSEYDVLRSVMEASEKAATGSRRATVNKIIGSNREIKETLDSMDKDVRGKVIIKAMGVAEVQTDESREKRISEFIDYSSMVQRAFEHNQAYKAFDAQAKKGRGLLKSGKVTPDIQERLGGLLDGLQGKQITKAQRAALDAAKTVEESELSGEIKALLEYAELTNPKDLTTSELNALTEGVKGLLKKSSDLAKEIRQNNKTKAQQAVFTALKSTASRTDRFSFSDVGMKVPEGDIFPKEPPAWIKAIQKFLDSAMSMAKNFDAVQSMPVSLARTLDGQTSGEFSRIQFEAEQSYRNVYKVQRGVSEIMSPVEPIIKKLNYSKNKPSSSITVNGEKIELGVADRLYFFLANHDTQTREMGVSGEGMGGNGWQREAGKPVIRLTQPQVDEIISQMSPEEKAVGDAYIQTARYFQEIGNERSIEMDGYRIFINDEYTLPRWHVGNVHINKDQIDIKVDLEKGIGFGDAFKKITVESSGVFKSRTSSKAPLQIQNPMSTLHSMEKLVARYYGMAGVLRDANRFMYYAKTGGVNSLHDALASKGYGHEFKVFDEYIRDLNNPNGRMMSEQDRLGEKIVGKAVEYLGARALSLNLKVRFLQLASIETARPYMSQEAFSEAHNIFGRFGKEVLSAQSPKGTEIKRAIDEMGKRSPFLWARYKGRVGIQLGDDARTKKQQRGMGDIRKNDAAVIYSIFKGLESQHSKNGLVGEELDAKIESDIINIIFRSQPSFEDVSRPALARSKNPMLRSFMMFSSYRNKLHQMIQDAVFSLIEGYRNNNLTKSDIDASKQKLQAVAISQMIAAGISVAMAQIINETLDAKGYKQIDRTMTAGEKTWDVTQQFASSYISYASGSLGPVAAALTGIINYGKLSMTPADAFLDDLEATQRLANHLEKLSEAQDNGDADSYMAENWMKIGDYASRVASTVTIPTTGFNAANFWKYYVEPIGQFVGREERVRQEKIDQTYEDTNEDE